MSNRIYTIEADSRDEFDNFDDIDVDAPEDPIETEPNANDEPNMREVEDARMIRKKMHADGTYEELWIYHVGGEGDYTRDERIRRSILQDTDIDPAVGKSDDGEQKMVIWRSGDVEFLELSGLPN